MITSYSYDVLTEIIELFQKSKIATFDIQDENGYAIVDYTTVDDYDPTAKISISYTLRNSLPLRLYIVELLNTYLEKKLSNEVAKFNASFNAYGVKVCTFDSSTQFSGKSTSKQEIPQKSITEKIDELIIDKNERTTLYRKEGTGRGKRYIPVTVGELADIFSSYITE